MKPSELMLDFGRPIAYHPGLVKYLGSVNAVILFDQLFYWTGKEADPDLGIYKTSEELTNETGLSNREQRTARAYLRDCGVLTETERKLEHKIFYKINLDRLNELVNGGSELRQPPLAKTHFGDGENANGGTTNCHPYIHRLHPETTTETTPEKERKEGRKEIPPTAVASLSVVPSDQAQKIMDAWYGLGFKPYAGDMDAANRLDQEHGMDKVVKLMTVVIHEVPATAKIAWRDLTFFADKFEFNARKAEAWLRSEQAKQSKNSRQKLTYNRPEYGGFAADAERQLFTPAGGRKRLEFQKDKYAGYEADAKTL